MNHHRRPVSIGVGAVVMIALILLSEAIEPPITDAGALGIWVIAGVISAITGGGTYWAWPELRAAAAWFVEWSNRPRCGWCREQVPHEGAYCSEAHRAYHDDDAGKY